MAQLGYCTNVHAGVDLAQTKANLQKYALEVKQRVSPTQPMGIGLWLSASAAKEVLSQGAADFAGWLQERGLIPFTLNGFPYGDFHQEVVQHQVYLPTWAEPSRTDYTLNLIEILDQILPAGMAGSISTLPLGWGSPEPDTAFLELCATSLREVSEHLARLEKERGRRITVCLEPEPGCILQRSTDLVRFFESHLLPRSNEDLIRRYICACHDVCHAAVMLEGQREVFERYQAAGIEVGKVQISSAIRLPMGELAHKDRLAALDQLAEAHEPRYLHQTMVTDQRGTSVFYENLPEALEVLQADPSGAEELTAHFHVPVYLDRFGLLEATQDAILECTDVCRELGSVEHFEVETYTWTVLPEELRVTSLAAGIAEELEWFHNVLQKSPDRVATR